MHSIGQSTKSPEFPYVRPCVQHFFFLPPFLSPFPPPPLILSPCPFPFPFPFFFCIPFYFPFSLPFPFPLPFFPFLSTSSCLPSASPFLYLPFPFSLLFPLPFFLPLSFPFFFLPPLPFLPYPSPISFCFPFSFQFPFSLTSFSFLLPLSLPFPFPLSLSFPHLPLPLSLSLLSSFFRDRWRHVTPKGQTHDPIIFEAPYLCNIARWTTHPSGRWYCQMDAWSLWTTHGLWTRPPGVKWSRDRWRHMTPKGQTRDPILFEARYLHNCAR